MKSYKTSSKLDTIVYIDELLKFKEEITDNDVLLQFVGLALNTGGRLQTILNIQKKDINLTNNTVTLKDIKNEST